MDIDDPNGATIIEISCIDESTQWSDIDGDGFGDNLYQADAFPNDPTQWEDLDGDGL